MRRLQIQTGKEPPGTLIARLREIDPTADLVFVESTLKGDVWWLGTVRTNDERRKMGERILQNEERRDHPNRRNVLLGQCLLQGFARVEAYTCEGDPESGVVRDSDGYECSIVQDFAERDKAWREDQGKAAFAANLDRSMGGPEARERERQGHDLILDGRDEFRRVKRGRRIFTLN